MYVCGAIKLPNILRMFNFTFSLEQNNKPNNSNCERKSSHVIKLLFLVNRPSHVRVYKFVIN